MSVIESEVTKLQQSAGECIDNSLPITVPKAISVGDMIAQGDIGLLVIKELPENADPVEWLDGKDFQLAPGSNKGSRHCIPSKYRDVVKVYSVPNNDPLSNLIVEATGQFDLVHPEHADHLGYPAQLYRVRHQQNEQFERVRD